MIEGCRKMLLKTIVLTQEAVTGKQIRFDDAKEKWKTK